MDADDLVQEMWIRAAGRLGRFEWRSTLRTWLGGILLNLVREAHRAASRMEFIEVGEEAAAWPAPPDLADRLELEGALAALGPGQRAVLVLHDVEGYTHDEIAELLDITPGTSKSQLCRARRAVVLFMNNQRKQQPYART
jgi:RNA polymerase sigma-70 factor (ECF subfamily)